jgi:ribosomal protein S27E
MNKALELDMIAGSQLRDTQGEMLSVEGCDISVLEAAKGKIVDNHGKGFFNCIGRITEAKKIFKKEDCDNERHLYYWNKVKAPYIYAKGYLFNDEDHQNAKAAAAIMRNIHKTDCPLKIKASVEGGTVSRGMEDPKFLAKTIVHSVALTFVPANQATLVEPLDLTKSEVPGDMELIRSVMHLAQTNVPSFRSIVRDSSANKVHNNLNKIYDIARQLDKSMGFDVPAPDEIYKYAIEEKVKNNVAKIVELTKALFAGYGGASAPTDRTGGSVLQPESLDNKKKKKIKKLEKSFKYITCSSCGQEQVYSTYQVLCRNEECGKAFPLYKIYDMITQKP